MPLDIHREKFSHIYLEELLYFKQLNLFTDKRFREMLL